MLKKEERKIRIKQIIEENPGIYHIKLLEIILKQGIMAKRTAEKDIEQMINDRKITVFTQKTRKCYALKGDDTFEGNLPIVFSKKIEIIKEKLEIMEKNFETHSYDAQRHMHGELCEMITKQIERSKEWAKELDHGYGEYSDEHDRICSKIRKLLKGVNGDRRHKILEYLENTMSAVREKNRTVNELDEKRKGMKSSKERDEISNQSKELNSQLAKVVANTISIRDALEYLQDQAGTTWDGNAKVVQHCGSLDYYRENSGNCVEGMMRYVKELKMLKKREGETKQTEQLNSQILEIKSRLEEIEKIIKILKIGGIQNERIEKLDSEISKAESYLPPNMKNQHDISQRSSFNSPTHSTRIDHR